MVISQAFAHLIPSMVKAKCWEPRVPLHIFPRRILPASGKNTICLVVLTILKNMKVNWEDYPIYYGK